jgi:DNA-binding MarR family transcriptional regulator
MSGNLTNVKMSTRIPPPKFPDQPDFIGRLVRDAFTALMAEATEHLAHRQADITPAQTRVMALIDPGGSRPAELARRAQMTRQSMGEILAVLHDLGFIELRSDPDDGRAKVAVLTEAGWDAMRSGLDAVLAVHRHWEQLLGERKMDQLMKLLRQLLDSLAAEQPT